MVLRVRRRYDLAMPLEAPLIATMTTTPDSEELPNQSPPFADVNLFTADAALQDAVKREGATYATRRLGALGAAFGGAAAFDRGRLANEFPPRLFTHDAQGRRPDVVEVHPAHHDFMTASM